MAAATVAVASVVVVPIHCFRRHLQARSPNNSHVLACCVITKLPPKCAIVAGKAEEKEAEVAEAEASLLLQHVAAYELNYGQRSKTFENDTIFSDFP